jgi:hypothetical protein
MVFAQSCPAEEIFSCSHAFSLLESCFILVYRSLEAYTMTHFSGKLSLILIVERMMDARADIVVGPVGIFLGNEDWASGVEPLV